MSSPVEQGEPPIEFRHFACLGKIRVKGHLRGQRIRCPKCGGGAKVPGATDDELARREAARAQKERQREVKRAEVARLRELAVQSARDAAPKCSACGYDWMSPGFRTEYNSGRMLVAFLALLLLGGLFSGAWLILAVGAAFASPAVGLLVWVGGPVFLLWLCAAYGRVKIPIWICPNCGDFRERVHLPHHRPVH